MSLASAELPSDPDALRAFALACQSELATANAELQAAKLAVQLHTLEIEKLKFQLAKLRRLQFGRSSERVRQQIEQLELRLEELETGKAEEISQAAAEDRPLPIRERRQPKRKPLPDHLPRQEVVHEPEHDGACACPACGGAMAKLGEDVTEVLDYTDVRLEPDNNIAENAMRHRPRQTQLALRRQSCRRQACRRNVFDPADCEIERGRPASSLTNTLTRIAQGHPSNRISELMPWAYRPPITQIAAQR
jgi:transposase